MIHLRMFSQNVVLLKGNGIKRRNDTEGVRKKDVKGIHRVPVPIMIEILAKGLNLNLDVLIITLISPHLSRCMVSTVMQVA